MKERITKKWWYLGVTLVVLVTTGIGYVRYVARESAGKIIYVQEYVTSIVSTTTIPVQEVASAAATATTTLPVTPYNVFTEALAAQKKNVTSTMAIQFFGDMMLDRMVAKQMGKRGLEYVFEKLQTPESQLFGSADLLVANLEGPFAKTRVPTSKTIAFRFDPALALQMKSFGFDGVSLANNHTLDMGRSNVPFTEKILYEQGIGYFGNQIKEDKALTWIVGKEEGYPATIAFLGFNNTDHPLAMAKVEEAIQDARQKADFVVVFMHWGIEYKRISATSQRTLAQWFIDHGADAVIGAHPHVIQEMELYNDKPIFYSLGNFIFDQYFSKDTQEGLSVGMILADNKISAIHLFPFRSIRSQIVPMTETERKQFLTWFEKNSRLGSKTITNGILNL